MGRYWLRYTAEVGITCFLCVKHKQHSFNNDIWTTSRPRKRICLQSIMKHEQSAAHRNSVLREAAAVSRTVITSAVNPAVPARGIEKAFSCLYFLAKKIIAYTTNFEPLLDLFRFLGMHIKGMLGTAKNATYTSDKSIQDMLYVISEVLETKILDDLKSSKHFALQFDETLDCTTTE